MSRNTAAKYVKLGKLPSELKKPRTWRTRPDPFDDDWAEVAQRFRDAPELEGKALFEELLLSHPDRYHPGQLRTFQRRLKQWRASEGPERSVFFAQEHRAGEAFQTDFTWATKLGITIGGESFAHLLCHVVLPYSNWEWVTVCRSESLAALKRGVQEALFRLGRVPAYHQTDNSTAATHDLTSGKRVFNDDYVDFMHHLGMEPRTITIGEKHQNGDVEALNGALKRRLKQHLLLRGSNDFESLEEYEAWLAQVTEKANRLRRRRFNEELAVMKPVTAERLPEFTEQDVRVTSRSTIYVKRNVYSVPSRLIGEMVRVRIFDDRLEVSYGGKHQLTVERLLGRGGHRINYRHIIWSLVRKPGAFRLFKYREDLFPSLVFRRAYDALCTVHGERKGSIEYLRILHLAASTVESEVEVALELLLEEGDLTGKDQIKSLVDSFTPLDPPEMAELRVDLTSYDTLLHFGEEVAS
jgi:transposase InsO family protein